MSIEWPSLTALQQPDWPEQSAVARVREQLAALPPLVVAGECSQLREALGRAVVGDESSKVVAGPSRRRPAAFAAGLHAERLFWRSIVGQSLPLALAAHVAEVARHALARAPFGTLPMLAGRLVALMQFGSYLPRYRQLRGLIEAGHSDAAVEDVTTIRIDGPHPGLAAPRRRPEVAPLRRSA